LAQKDLNEKLLEEYNDVFADIFNVLLFENDFVKESNLESGPTESVYKTVQGDAAAQGRDILKKYKENHLCICSFGIENQTTVDSKMPVRVMGYDYGSYKGMLANSEEISPVTTIVLNFSDKKWNTAKSLHEMMKLPDELKPYVENYKIRVYDIAFLSDNIIEKFTSDFKVIARFFKEKRLKGMDFFKDSDMKIRHVGAVLDFFSVFTKDNRYREAYTEKFRHSEQKGDAVNMCEMLQSLIDEGIAEGLSRGHSQGLSQGLAACVAALKMTGVSFEKTFETITSIDTYKDVAREEIFEYYNR
jgi:hypothetical protein